MELATIEGSIMNCRTPTHDCSSFERDCRHLYKAIDLCRPHLIDLDPEHHGACESGQKNDGTIAHSQCEDRRRTH
ncbi:hypothetical protein [Rhodoplanes elegans]|uniref:hypothetical protein n=1 Tax=Rhodoplanes elegans TaxID=29408 RepID=UPI001A92EFC4|nr:hypothetical protein [Rhodoplanes elegans]